MAASSTKAPRAALYVLANAWYRTKPRTREEALHCSMQMARTRDFLLHEPATDIVVGGVEISAAEYEAERNEAIRELRLRCRACGLCAELGMKPP